MRSVKENKVNLFNLFAVDNTIYYNNSYYNSAPLDVGSHHGPLGRKAYQTLVLNSQAQKQQRHQVSPVFAKSHTGPNINYQSRRYMVS